MVHDSQASRCELLQLIIQARAEFFDASGVCAVPQRVASKQNQWADWLSRGEWQRVIAACIELGLQPVWVDVPQSASVLRKSVAKLANELKHE